MSQANRYILVGETTAIDNEHPSQKIGIFTDNRRIHPYGDIGGSWLTIGAAKQVHIELGAAIALVEHAKRRED
jgi:hypothetical protein